MKKMLWIFVFCVFAGPSAQAEDSLQQALQARYELLTAAMANREGPAISAMLAPDFTAVSVDGKTMTGADMVKTITALPKDSAKNSMTVVSAAQNGDMATVAQRYVTEGTKKMPDGTVRNLKMTAESTDTWVKPKDVWLIKKTVTDQMDFYADGKLIAHKGPGGTTTPPPASAPPAAK